MIDWNLTAAVAVAVLSCVAVGILAVVAWRAVAVSGRAVVAARQWHYELCEGLAELSAANAALRRQLAELTQRVEQHVRAQPVHAAPANVRAYDLAARLAGAGAAASELVSSCGLTPAEAELAVLVHGARAPGAAVTAH
jgi:hypothetical protein